MEKIPTDGISIWHQGAYFASGIEDIRRSRDQMVADALDVQRELFFRAIPTSFNCPIYTLSLATYGNASCS